MSPVSKIIPRYDYFCQVRFLWRLARNFFLRLCLLILLLRRFLSEPIFCFSVYDFVQWIFNNSFRARSLELRNQFANHSFVDDCFDCNPALLA